jgi:O-antigen ligase
MLSIQPIQLTASRSVLFLAVCIPISVAMGNILLAILLLCGLSASRKEIWERIRTNPVARASALLFIFLLLGCLIGSTPLGNAVAMVGKYVDLIFIPFFIVLFQDEALRLRAENAFVGMMVLTAILSWMIGWGILGESFCLWSGCSAGNPSIFLSHITHNLMMAYVTFLLALRARAAIARRPRIFYGLLATLTGSNVLLMVQGRTGYVVLGVLMAYFGWLLVRQRLNQFSGMLKMAGILAFMIVLFASVWMTYQLSPRLQERMSTAVAEMNAWKTEGRDDTSIGLRLAFYSNTLNIIADHPWVGVGTGGFSEAFRQQVEGTGTDLARNPHNEYLHLTVQLGIAGFILFIYLLYTQWKTARRINFSYHREAALGLMLALLVTSLFNTPLMDHTEGLFFAYMSALYFSSFHGGASHA